MSQEDICKEHHKEFFGSLYALFKHPFKSIWKIGHYDCLSQQLTNNINDFISLYTDYKELSEEKDFLVTKTGELREKIEVQGGIIDRLNREKNELRDEIDSLNKRAKSLEEKIEAYQKGATETPEYKMLAGAYGTQKKINRDLQNALRESYDSHVKEVEERIIDRARKTDKNFSYVYIKGLDEILVVTPEFEEKYHFNNEELRGLKYFKVLKDANMQYIEDLKKLFKDPQERKLQTMIIDGKRKERAIYFVKHEPEFVKGLISDGKGNLIEERVYFTRVDVHDFGIVQRTKEGFLKIIHRNGPPKKLQEFVEQQHIREFVGDEINKLLAKKFPSWAKYGIKSKEIEKISDDYENYKDFRKKISDLLRLKRRQEREDKRLISFGMEKEEIERI